MTEATPETPTLTEVLVRNGIYIRNGENMIATGDTTLSPLTGKNMVEVNPQDVELADTPGSERWVERMARLRTLLVHNHNALAIDLDRKIDHINSLGQAILEKAVEHDWCGEYDEFADEWDLPRRVSNFTVTMTVQVEARDEDAASDIVAENVHLNAYSTDGVMTDPEFSVSEAY